MNVRFFVVRHPGEPPLWRFGGGMDVTPYYGFEEGVRHFHAVCRRALEPFGAERYPRYKRACDAYFFLAHRGEACGIGGIFFDDLAEPDFAIAFALARAAGDHFLAAYTPILERPGATPYGERERAFRLLRRGRYAQFNLVYDRGTLFGLQSGERTESILISLPPLAAWAYDWKPEPGSPEERLAHEFLRPRDWV